MVRECFKLKTGILFHQDAFAVIGMDYNTLWPHVKPRPPPVTTFSKGHPPPLNRPFHTMGINHTSTADDDFVNEEEEDLADALSPINDMLEIAKSWWILELIPQQIRFQTDEDSWVRKLSCVTCFLSSKFSRSRRGTGLIGAEDALYRSNDMKASSCTAR